MKKSLIALAVSAAVVAPSFAVADVAVKGDARYRMNSKTGDAAGFEWTDASSNSRVRIKVEGKGDGYYVKSRFSTADGTVGGSRGIKSDYGYLGVMLGPVTVEGGRIPDNWGNRFRSWDEDWDGMQVMFKAGDMDIAVWREMVSEGGPYNTDLTTSTNIGANPWTGKAGNYVVQTDEADTVSMGVDVTGKAGMGNFGLRFISTTSEAAAADASGSEIDAYYNGKIGPGMLIASYVNQSGDLNEDGDGDARQGMYIHWIQKFGGITGEVGLVQSNSFKADDHFALFSTVGTSQDTAVMNFGAGPMGAGTMKELQVLAAKASMMATPKTKVTVGLGMASGKVVDGADSGSGNAVDLIVTHKIGKGTKAYASYGTLTMDEDLSGMGDDVKLSAMGAGIETKF